MQAVFDVQVEQFVPHAPQAVANTVGVLDTKNPVLHPVAVYVVPETVQEVALVN